MSLETKTPFFSSQQFICTRTLSVITHGVYLESIILPPSEVPFPGTSTHPSIKKFSLLLSLDAVALSSTAQVQSTITSSFSPPPFAAADEEAAAAAGNEENAVPANPRSFLRFFFFAIASSPSQRKLR